MRYRDSVSRIIITLSISMIFFFCLSLFCPVSSEGSRIVKWGMNPSGDVPLGKAARKAAEIVKQKTNGGIEIQIFHSAQIGNEQEILQGMSLGTTDMSGIIGGTYANILPDFSVVGMAYCFRDIDHMQKVWRSEVGKSLEEKVLRERNIKIIDSTWVWGLRHLTTNKPVKVPDDLKGMKIRMVPAQVYQFSWATLGAIPTPVEWGDVYVALKTGMVDGQENPLSLIRVGAIYQVNKYLALTGHTVANVILAASKKFYDSLSSEERKIVEDAFIEAGKYNNELVEKSDQDDLKWLQEKGGMTVVKPDVEAFRRKAAVIPEKFENGKWLELYRKIQDIK